MQVGTPDLHEFLKYFNKFLRIFNNSVLLRVVQKKCKKVNYFCRIFWRLEKIVVSLCKQKGERVAPIEQPKVKRKRI